MNTPGQIEVILDKASPEVHVDLIKGSLQELASPRDSTIADSVFKSMDSQIAVMVRDKKEW